MRSSVPGRSDQPLRFLMNRHVPLRAHQNKMRGPSLHRTHQLNSLFRVVSRDRHVVSQEHSLVQCRISHGSSLSSALNIGQNQVVSIDDEITPNYDAARASILEDLSRGKLAYTAAEAAAVTGIPVDRIRRVISGGGMPGLNPQGFSRYLVRPESISGWLAMGGPSGGARYVNSLAKGRKGSMSVEPDEPTLDKPKLSYSVSEASDATGVSEGHLRRLVRDGYLAAVKPAGTTRLLIRTSELQSWLDSGG